MDKVVSWYTRLRNREVGAHIYDRENKVLTREKLHLRNWLENKVLYTKPFDKIDRTRWLRKQLHNESSMDGHKFKKYKSAAMIPQFIDFYGINMNDFERARPQDYLTFSDFFTRKVKPEARPISEPENDNVIVSGCDCRLTVFKNIMEAQNLLIKGKHFSLDRLVGHRTDLTDQFQDASVMNMRLTPMDYHHFHAPMAGTITESYYLPGEIFNTITDALKSEIDVLDENERQVFLIEAPNNRKALVCVIAAEGVGTLTIQKKVGDTVTKGERIGFFSWGDDADLDNPRTIPSDVLVLFDFDIKFDADINMYSHRGIETLVKMGERVGEVVTV